MKHDRSFGIIPTRVGNRQRLYLLIRHHAGHWGFPKGHADADETGIQAARRELREETGIAEVDVSDDVEFTEEYRFSRDGQMFHKTVTYYLGTVNTSAVVIQDEELQDFRWVPFRQAMELITFPEGKRLLTAARDYVAANRKQTRNTIRQTTKVRKDKGQEGVKVARATT